MIQISGHTPGLFRDASLLSRVGETRSNAHQIRAWWDRKLVVRNCCA